MRSVRSRKVFNTIPFDEIKDPAAREFCRLLMTYLAEHSMQNYDDINSLQNVEKVTALPTASVLQRGKFLLLDNGAAADTLHVCRDSAVDGTYEWKTVTLA